MTIIRSWLACMQSTEEKMRSDPLVTMNSIWLVPTFTSQGSAPLLVTVMVSMGFVPAE